MYMRFYWVRHQVEQKYFGVKWNLGHMKLWGYFTKQHKPTHHRIMIQTYLMDYSIAKQERVQ